MRRGFRFAGLAALVLLALPSVASAQIMATTTTDLNMRAGPSSGHAIVGVIPSYHHAVVHGCTQDGRWCEVSYGPATGWSHARYLQFDQHVVAIAGPPPTPPQPGPQVQAEHVQTAAPLLGIAGGALAGGLIAGPPGALIGGFAAGLLSTQR